MYLFKTILFNILVIIAFSTNANAWFDDETFNNHECGEMSDMDWYERVDSDTNGAKSGNMSGSDKKDIFYFVATDSKTLVSFKKRSGNVGIDFYSKDCSSINTSWKNTKYHTDQHGNSDSSDSYETYYLDTTPGEVYYIKVRSNGRYNLGLRSINTVAKYQYTKFKMVNPKETRNMPGDFIIIGNASLCRFGENKKEHLLPSEENPIAQQCYLNGNIKPVDNNYVMNYIDIDGDNKTWNSSSASFELKEGSEVAWAGLFWMGHVMTKIQPVGSQHIYTRMAKKSTRRGLGGFFGGGSSYYSWDYSSDHEDNSVFDPKDFDEEKILVKVDDGSYKEITASKDNVHFSGYHDNIIPMGGPYSAYADVTDIVKASMKDSMSHKITVANLTSTMGLESNLGLFGGWSMVVIYKNPTMHPKSISIFDGFAWIDSQNAERKEKIISVKGFKLPTSSDIKATLGIFTGEGEVSIPGDSVYIDGQKVKKDYLGNSIKENNIFDGVPIFDGERYPNHKYTGTMDFSLFDASKILTDKQDRSINKLDIKIACDKNIGTDDYIASMIAFSVDLYIPEVCYDYDIRMGEDVPIGSENRDINSSIIPGHNIHAVVALRSREGDLNLDNSTLALKFNKQASKIKFINAKQSSDDVNFYEDAKIINNTNPIKVAVGKDAHIAPGTIKPKQTTYADFEYEIKTPNLDTNFDIIFNATIDYGSGDLNVTKSTLDGTLMRCGTEKGYNPPLGLFNVERVDSDDFSTSQPNKRFPLYTQVAGKKFKLHMVHYDKDGKREVELDKNLDVMLELIDANRFHIDEKTGKSIFVCSYPQGIPGTKDTRGFGSGESRHSIVFNTDTSLPNVAVRIKYVVSPTGKLVSIFDCDHGDNRQCNKNAYDGNFEGDSYCNTICDKNSNTTDRECRNCIEKYWVKSVCSRDNFAIRPESYNISIYDTNQSKENDAKQLVVNDKKDKKNFVAQYQYLVDANATLYRSKKSVSSYYQDFNLEGESELNYNDTKFDTALTLYNKNASSCNNKKSKRYKLSFYNGKVLGKENKISSKPMGAILESSDIGKYLLHIADKDFTIVDQKSYPNKRYKTDDCLVDNTTVTENYSSGINGCVTATDINGIGHSGSKHYDIDMGFVPDHFDLSDIKLTRGSSNNKKWIYMSSLPSTMALKASGLITAVGAKGDNLSNFTSSCLAKDVNMSIKLKSNPGLDNIYSSNGIKVDFKYMIGTNNVSVTQNGSFLNSSDNFSTDENETTHAFALNKNMFTNDLNGSARLNVNYNFERSYNDPVNPVKLSVKKMKTSIDDIAVNGHMKADYTPEGIREYNEDFTFFYGAGIPSRNSYSTKESNITTPVSVRIYCDRLYEECKEKGIDGANAQLTLPWWRPDGHDSYSGDGQIILKVDSHSKISINKGALDISTTTGEDQDIIVTNIDATQDVEYPVDLVTEPTTPATSDWLIYNEIDNSIPTPFYTNKFLGGSGWAGIGESGKTLDAKAPIRKNNRLQW